MKMFSIPGIDGLLYIQSDTFKDNRGDFSEIYHSQKYSGILNNDKMQLNMSHSIEGTLRGLHIQKDPFMQGKLVTVPYGKIQDVAVDLRKDSASFKKYFSVILSKMDNNQLWIPKGFAHGFLALEQSIVVYGCDNFYDKDSESGIKWNDPTLNIKWRLPESKIIISEKDDKLATVDDAIIDIYDKK